MGVGHVGEDAPGGGEGRGGRCQRSLILVWSGALKAGGCEVAFAEVHLCDVMEIDGAWRSHRIKKYGRVSVEILVRLEGMPGGSLFTLLHESERLHETALWQSSQIF